MTKVISLGRRGASIGAAVLAVVALAACAGSPAAELGADGSDLGLVKDDVLTVCANFGTPPNIYAEEDGTPVGAEVDIAKAKAMADVMDLDVTFPEYAFSGLIPALQAKQCDTIISSLYIKPEREEVADFVPYLYSGSGLAVSKENPKDVTGYDESLCGTKSVGITGATGAALLEEKSAECESDGKEAIQITLVDRSADALQQVLAGQADVFMDTSELMSYYQKQSGGDFVVVGDPVGQIKIGAATLKDNAPLHEALQDAFDTILDDGTYDEILTEWGLEDQHISNA